jgi:hypothetical protein
MRPVAALLVGAIGPSGGRERFRCTGVEKAQTKAGLGAGLARKWGCQNRGANAQPMICNPPST